MNLACSTIGFTQQPLAEALSRIEALGFEDVDLLLMENWAHLNPSQIAEDPQQHAEQINELLHRHHLKPIGINTGTSHPLSSLAPDQIARNQHQGEGLIRLAGMLSVPVVVLQPGRVLKGMEFDQALEASCEALRNLVPIAAAHEVTLAIETHVHSLAEQYEDALRFTRAVPGLKLAYDPSHFVMAEFDLAGSEALLPDAAHVHLRNAVAGDFQASMAKGVLDFDWVLEALARHHYAGAVAIEYLDGREEDAESEILALKRLLEERL